jgi:hypothetical protein
MPLPTLLPVPFSLIPAFKKLLTLMPTRYTFSIAIHQRAEF